MIELKDSEFFRHAIEAIASFIPEGNFRFSDKGVFFKAIDPSQVVLVDYFIDKKLFDKYVLEPAFVGVDMVEFSKILQRSITKDKLILEVSDAEIRVRFEGDMKRGFKLPLIDVSDDEVKLPEITYESKVEVNAGSLKELLRDASLFGSSIVLKVTDGKFFVEAKGSQGAMESEATKAASVTSKKDVTAKFSLNFLQNIVKESDVTKNVTIELKNDAPMRVTYPMGGSKITFYLAHMIL